MRAPHRFGFGGLLVASAALFVAAPAHAGFLTFSGMDPGVGPGSASPATDAAIASFSTSAASLGNVAVESFESAPLGNFTSLQLNSDLNVALTNTDQATPVGFNFGITTGADPSVYGPSDVLKLGYNTTPGGSQFLAFAPVLNAGTATARFDFAIPTHAFGVTLTGLGSSTGDLHLVFNDGTDHDIAIPGETGGGIQFIGITDTAGIHSLSLVMRDVTGSSRDVFGIDDIRYTNGPRPFQPTPEPSSFLLACAGGLGLLWSYRRRLGSSA